MRKIVFEGCATALITPFCESGIDYAAFEKLTVRQIEAGVSALVIAGTTGEAPTLEEDEWEKVLSLAVRCSAGRTKVIAGCGSNSTSHTIERVKKAGEAGADAVLAVTPYYNKASADGLVRHYTEVCEASEVPVIAYNVPSRTGVDLDVGVCGELVKIENLAGIKEASGSVSRSACLISRFKDSLPVYSGSDEVNLPILSIGGRGVISVVSNVFPGECVEMCRLASEGKIKAAREISSLIYSFVSALFCEVNPIPVKTVMARLGYCEERFRLPLCRISEKNGERVMREYRKLASVFGE